VIAYVIMHGLCYDWFYILMPYGDLMDQWNVCMYVYIYVCVCVCLCMCVCMHVCIYVCMYACMHASRWDAIAMKIQVSH
jgi:hypothetical protein